MSSRTPFKRKAQEPIGELGEAQTPIEEPSASYIAKQKASSPRKLRAFPEPTEEINSSTGSSKNLTESLNKAECEDICRKLEQTEDVVMAFYGYTVAVPKKIEFQCISKKEKATDKISKYGQTFYVNYKTINCHNKEDEHLVDRERECKIIDPNKMDEIEGLIAANKKYLERNHSNLIDMFACSLKSTGYDTKQQTFTETPCIVFLVKCKCVIPLGEELLPPTIGKFQTDVREAYFFRKANGRPTSYYQRIINGSEIGTTIEKSGTICMFVDYRNKGLKGMTCAHVLLSDVELKKARENVRDFPLERICFQPGPAEEKHRCGKLFIVKFTDRLDVALFDIDESRIPEGGHFPGFKNNIGIPLPNFSSGDVLDHEQITVEMPVHKYGAVTMDTQGKISAINKTTWIDDERIKGVFEVRPLDSKPFSKSGDSGALVFSLSATNEVKGIGMLVGGHERRDYVIPLNTILRSFGNCAPATF